MLVVAGPVGERGHERTGHPERPARLTAAMAGVHDLELGDDLMTVGPAPVSADQLARVHDRRHLEWLEAQPPGQLDADTYLAADSWDTALRAAGAGLAAVDTVGSHAGAVGFVAARPPGHHAERHRAMGFCLINNIAVAAAELAARGERVAVIDWDVHHGNGTQEIFWDVPEVLYVSTHQSPWYPGTGRPDEVGGTHARGQTLNLPLPAGATGDVLRRAFEEIAGPVVERFAPSWVLVSAGYDAHRADPLAHLELSSGDFAALARIVASYGTSKIVLFLEGGYDLDALRASVAASLGALVDAAVGTEAPTAGGPGDAALESSRRAYEGALS